MERQASKVPTVIGLVMYTEQRLCILSTVARKRRFRRKPSREYVADDFAVLKDTRGFEEGARWTAAKELQGDAGIPLPPECFFQLPASSDHDGRHGTCDV